MVKTVPHRLLAVAWAACLALSACSDGNEVLPTPPAATAPPPVTSTPPSTTSVTVSGQVYAAIAVGADVSVYAADVQGRPSGAALGKAVTDGQGQYTVSLSTTPVGAVVVVATGGTYVSEADGTTQTLGTLSALLSAVTTGANTVQINPLTDTVASATANLLTTTPGNLASALATATINVQKLLGVSSLTLAPGNVAPNPLATSGDAWLLAALAGTLEQLRVNAAVTAADLYQALRDDVADGKLDGLKNGLAILVGSTGRSLQSSLFTTQWSGAANAYGTSHPALAGATASISGALQTAAQAVGVAIGSSGSIAPLQTQAGGTQLYFAARADGLVQLDMSNAANPVATKVAAINSAVMRNNAVSPATGYFTSLDGIIINPTPINTANGAKVFAILYSYSSKTVVSVNLTDGVVADTALLTITKSTPFSGATAAIAGGIADGVRGKIWLATGDGLLGLDPSNLKATPVAIAQPANTTINENIGGDPAKDIVYTPDYDNNGLVVFNLAEAKAYVMDNPTWTATTGNWLSTTDIDGVALDSQYNVAVLTPEGGGQVAVMTYAKPSGATTAVGSIPAGPRFKAVSTGASFAGSAFDPVSHTGLFVGEGSNLGVGVLDDPTAATWQGISRFVRAGTSSYRFEPHDPHTVGAFNVAGKPYGFLLQGSSKPYKVVVVDLNAFLAASASNGVLNADPMLDTSITKQLTY